MSKKYLPWSSPSLSTSDQPTSAAASFTRNAFKVAPALVRQEAPERNEGKARGLVANSGCANASADKQGLEDVWAMAKSKDGSFTLPHHFQPSTFVMSTGVIGQNLPIKKIMFATEGLKG